MRLLSLLSLTMLLAFGCKKSDDVTPDTQPVVETCVVSEQKISSSDLTIQYRYNSRGLLSSMHYVAKKPSTFQTDANLDYDDKNKLLKITTQPVENFSTYEYNSNGQLTKVSYTFKGVDDATPQTTVRTFEYTNGVATRETFSNGDIFDYEYDNDGHIIKAYLTQGDNKRLFKRFEYDNKSAPNERNPTQPLVLLGFADVVLAIQTIYTVPGLRKSNQTLVESYDENEEIFATATSEITYNTAENVTKIVTTYKQNGAADKVVESNIEYDCF